MLRVAVYIISVLFQSFSFSGGGFLLRVLFHCLTHVNPFKRDFGRVNR